MHTYMPGNSILDGPIKTLLSILCSLIEALSCAHSTGGKEGGGYNTDYTITEGKITFEQSPCRPVCII